MVLAAKSPLPVWAYYFLVLRIKKKLVIYDKEIYSKWKNNNGLHYTKLKYIASQFQCGPGFEIRAKEIEQHIMWPHMPLFKCVIDTNLCTFLVWLRVSKPCNDKKNDKILDLTEALFLFSLFRLSFFSVM